MIGLSPEAETRLDGLLLHYERLQRVEAAENLLAALERASVRIEEASSAGLPAPRPYPVLARLGFRWIREGSYWIAYSPTRPPVIVGVFHATADIPNRA